MAHPISSEHIVDLRGVKTTAPRKIEVKEEKPKKAPEKTSSQKGILYEWQAPEFIKYKKDPYWIWMVIVGAIVFTVFFILTKNYTGTVVVILSAFLIYVYGKKEPREINFAIITKGILINNKVHLFEDLKSFWIFYSPPEIKELSIKTKKLLSPYLPMPLGKANPVKIREILLDFLPEKKQEESIANILARRLGF